MKNLVKHIKEKLIVTKDYINYNKRPLDKGTCLVVKVNTTNNIKWKHAEVVTAKYTYDGTDVIIRMPGIWTPKYGYTTEKRKYTINKNGCFVYKISIVWYSFLMFNEEAIDFLKDLEKNNKMDIDFSEKMDDTVDMELYWPYKVKEDRGLAYDCDFIPSEKINKMINEIK